jgi:hypothetical protein
MTRWRDRPQTTLRLDAYWHPNGGFIKIYPIKEALLVARQTHALDRCNGSHSKVPVNNTIALTEVHFYILSLMSRNRDV